MSKNKPIIAMMYDFDKTLCTKDMQEYTFIPGLNMTAKEFWDKTVQFRTHEKMDAVLAYMYQMLHQSNKSDKSVHREDFVMLGKDIEFFHGIDTWFDRVNAYAKQKGACVEHYVISSGLKEIIEGTSIAKRFKEIYACEFYYDQNGVAKWPKFAVNYTEKTQFLFRINKGVLDVDNNEMVNKYIPERDRRIPFRNMIYIGDGLTDVPCMQLVKINGGKSIAVYGPHKSSAKQTAAEIVRDGRANFMEVADYSAGKDLEKLVYAIIDKIVATDVIAKAEEKCETISEKTLKSAGA